MEEATLPAGEYYIGDVVSCFQPRLRERWERHQLPLGKLRWEDGYCVLAPITTERVQARSKDRPYGYLFEHDIVGIASATLIKASDNLYACSYHRFTHPVRIHFRPELFIVTSGAFRLVIQT
jgi:hypothetical protein